MKREYGIQLSFILWLLPLVFCQAEEGASSPDYNGFSNKNNKIGISIEKGNDYTGLKSAPVFYVDSTSVREGRFHAKVISADEIHSNYFGYEKRRIIKSDLSDFPELISHHFLLKILYRLALEESMQSVRADGAFMAGKKWTGVWTRDISYSIHLAMAFIHPEASRKSLMAKTFSGRIRQDTGTGGAWPVSTDRTVWSLAAWELYLVTGDIEFLKQVYPMLKRMAKEDWRIARDPVTNLMRGESSFMDWRAQTYPRWMEPIHIFQSRCLSTNILHVQTYKILALMAGESGYSVAEAAFWLKSASLLQNSILRYLWDEKQGLLRAYLYPEPDNTPSAQLEALGSALAVLLGIVSKESARKIIANYPVVSYGVPTIFPQKAYPDKPYHNKGIWPFVQAYWALAGAACKNMQTFAWGMASQIRVGALMLSFKENFVYNTGRPEDTAINSDRQLWSVAGFLSMIYRGLFGIKPEIGGIIFQPTVPKWMGGLLNLRNFKIRDAVLDIKIIGYGTRLKRLIFDGRNLNPKYPVPYSLLKGRHKITLNLSPGDNVNKVNLKKLNEDMTAPDIPGPLSVKIEGHDNVVIRWPTIKDQDPLTYTVMRNGLVIGETSKSQFSDREIFDFKRKSYTYIVWATDPSGNCSAHSLPETLRPRNAVKIFEAENSRVSAGKISLQNYGQSGKGFIKGWAKPETSIEFIVHVSSAGHYLAKFRYANGAGPINTDKKCAIRSLYHNDWRIGSVILPQRGKDKWSNWGFSNPLTLKLKKGKNRLLLSFDSEDQNMDETVNTVNIDCLHLIKKF
ncbi:glycogen debranching protein [Candidatus Riflebacteria bacterium]